MQVISNKANFITDNILGLVLFCVFHVLTSLQIATAQSLVSEKISFELFGSEYSDEDLIYIHKLEVGQFISTVDFKLIRFTMYNKLYMCMWNTDASDNDKYKFIMSKCGQSFSHFIRGFYTALRQRVATVFFLQTFGCLKVHSMNAYRAFFCPFYGRYLAIFPMGNHIYFFPNFWPIIPNQEDEKIFSKCIVKSRCLEGLKQERLLYKWKYKWNLEERNLGKSSEYSKITWSNTNSQFWANNCKIPNLSVMGHVPKTARKSLT